MEKIVEQTLLYDFYGELLNEHQKNVYEDIVFNDLSLSEVADEYGISRQGVFDLVKRIDKKLANYEDKLHLVNKFMSAKSKLQDIVKLTDDFAKDSDMPDITTIREIANEIINDF